MSATHAHELNAAAQSGQPSSHSTSPVLWMALLLAILVGVLTLMWRHAERAPAVPASAETTPVVAAPTLDAPAAMRTPATASHGPRKPAAAVGDRQARPLAGNPSPTYPPAALRAGVEGSVVASLQVDAQGKVTDASIVSHDGERSRDLDRAVLDTLGSWKFEPALRNGRAVATVVRVPVDFRTGR